jgi:hypothetical protein
MQRTREGGKEACLELEQLRSLQPCVPLRRGAGRGRSPRRRAGLGGVIIERWLRHGVVHQLQELLGLHCEDASRNALNRRVNGVRRRTLRALRICVRVQGEGGGGGAWRARAVVASSLP